MRNMMQTAPDEPASSLHRAAIIVHSTWRSIDIIALSHVIYFTLTEEDHVSACSNKCSVDEVVQKRRSSPPIYFIFSVHCRFVEVNLCRKYDYRTLFDKYV